MMHTHLRTTHVSHYWSRLHIMYNKGTSRQVNTQTYSAASFCSCGNQTKPKKKVKTILLHAYSILIATGAGGGVFVSISLPLGYDAAPRASQRTVSLHRFLCCRTDSSPFPCSLLWTETGWTSEELSDVEDPWSALKDGRRVRRELGPHQMLLSQEMGNKKKEGGREGGRQE